MNKLNPPNDKALFAVIVLNLIGLFIIISGYFIFFNHSVHKKTMNQLESLKLASNLRTH